MSSTDSPWQTILSAALMGTERQPFQPPIATGNLGQTLAQLNGRPTEAALLSAAAAISLHQRVGWLPETRATSTPAPCPTDDLPRCSPLAAHCLQQILQGQYPHLLSEWLNKATIAGQRVPEMALPAVLDKGRQQRDLRAMILPVLGQRGQWLAAQNPDWSYAVALTTDADWETGTSAARLLYLQDLRSRDPDRARALLQATWSQEAAGDRTKFLETLRIGLSLADEPFLEMALADRRSREVRRLAADLLASLPASHLCQQIAAYTGRYLSLNQSGKTDSLAVQPPDQLAEPLMQLGIEPKPPTTMAAPIGEKAWWLLQLVGATPLPIWAEQWQQSPQEILALTRCHDLGSAVLAGLALAAKRQNHPLWLEAIFQFWVMEPGLFKPAALLDLSIADLFNALPSDRQNALLIQLIQRSNLQINESLTMGLLRSSSPPWSCDLAQLVLEHLETHLTKTTILTGADWELRTTLKDFARFVPIAFISKVIQLRTQLSQESPWMQGVDDFLALLQFRQDMAKAFDGGV